MRKICDLFICFCDRERKVPDLFICYCEFERKVCDRFICFSIFYQQNGLLAGDSLGPKIKKRVFLLSGTVFSQIKNGFFKIFFH